MTACPIRYQRQVPDRKGKIFYTSITSLSHISKFGRAEAEQIASDEDVLAVSKRLIAKNRKAYEVLAE